MQLIVLGMHRSGTSLAARLLHSMGVYTGDPALFGANDDNPTGYWERRDVVECNAALLRQHQPHWQNLIVTPWIARFTPPPPPVLQQRMQVIMNELNAHPPWVLKDPHFCLTLPHWRPILTTPVCLILTRDPREVARSLAIRRHNAVPDMARGLALWEYYAVSLLKASAGLPRITVHHAGLLNEPVRAVQTLYEALTTQGVRGLRLPNTHAITALIDPALYRARKEESPLALSPFQAHVAAMLHGDVPIDPEIQISAQTLYRLGITPG